MKKTQISAQTIFYIMMAIIFITILIFGFQKIFDVHDTLNEQDRIKIKDYMKTSFSYCEDPLNKGNFKTFEIENDGFNVICLLGEDVKEVYENYPDFLTLYNTSQDVIIIDSSWTQDEDGTYQFENYYIVDSLKLNTGLSKTKCFVKNSGKNLIEVKIKCD